MTKVTNPAKIRSGCVKWLSSQCRGGDECTCLRRVPEPRRKVTREPAAEDASQPEDAQ